MIGQGKLGICRSEVALSLGNHQSKIVEVTTDMSVGILLVRSLPRAVLVFTFTVSAGCFSGESASPSGGSGSERRIDTRIKSSFDRAIGAGNYSYNINFISSEILEYTQEEIDEDIASMESRRGGVGEPYGRLLEKHELNILMTVTKDTSIKSCFTPLWECDRLESASKNGELEAGTNVDYSGIIAELNAGLEEESFLFLRKRY